MNLLDFTLDINTLIFKNLPSENLQGIAGASKKSLELVNLIDDVFKRKEMRRCEIRSLKNWSIVKMIFLASFWIATIPLQLVALPVFAIAGGVFGYCYDVEDLLESDFCNKWVSDVIKNSCSFLYKSTPAKGLFLGKLVAEHLGSLGTLYLINKFTIDYLELVREYDQLNRTS